MGGQAQYSSESATRYRFTLQNIVLTMGDDETAKSSVLTAIFVPVQPMLLQHQENGGCH
jgi:hypothetical protein